MTLLARVAAILRRHDISFAIIGASGGEYQRRGHVRAYDARTGRMIWEFFTTPGPGEFGHDTWAGESWRTGGGTVWTTPSFDPELGLVYITTGNAAPDENGSERAGTNLFTLPTLIASITKEEIEARFDELFAIENRAISIVKPYA